MWEWWIGEPLWQSRRLNNGINPSYLIYATIIFVKWSESEKYYYLLYRRHHDFILKRLFNHKYLHCTAIIDACKVGCMSMVFSCDGIKSILFMTSTIAPRLENIYRELCFWTYYVFNSMLSCGICGTTCNVFRHVALLSVHLNNKANLRDLIAATGLIILLKFD